MPPGRVSTIIFGNGMTYPSHFGDNHHIVATFLGFENLAIPAGLQYVDDVDVVGSSSERWR